MHFSKSETTSNQVIILEVKDNGIGMKQEVLKRCLEPFFTTKEVGEGTGLGLSVTLGIIRELNFHLAVESSEGEGATFRVVIPVEIADRIA
jgi:signal transduction histidine kinase